MKRKTVKIQKYLYMLVDREGALNGGPYDTIQEAKDDAWGPIFSEFKVVRYVRTSLRSK